VIRGQGFPRACSLFGEDGSSAFIIVSVFDISCFVIFVMWIKSFMPYRYLEEIGTADIAFEATGRDLPELFTAAADATMNVMIDNLNAIDPRETRQIELSNDNIEMLLFDFLQELIYLKDARRLLLRVRETQIDHKGEEYFLKAKAAGEQLDATRHQQRADVKAVTLHGFSVEKEDHGWKARVLLDI
jgi:SHS2 domain-containing protein